jgi:nucleotide-binding universal stress UspA family protein
MYRTIVWATDGSDGAELARLEAARLCASTGARLVAAHQDQRYVGRAAGWPVLPDEGDRLQRIRRDVEEMQHAGLHVELVARHGTRDPADVVAEIAEDEDAELIVCGTRGLGPLAGAVVGSVAHRLLHVAPCPVLVVSARAQRVREREAAKAKGVHA